MVANWQYGEEGRWWQRLRCRCFRVGDAHSTDFLSPFFSHFIRFFFSPLPLKPCGCCTWLIMMQNVRPHPTSTPLHDTFYVKISVTFECVTGLSFCRLLGVGLQQPISKLRSNGYVTRVVLTQTLNHMTRFRNGLRDLLVRRTCGRSLPFAGWLCWGWVYTQKYQNEIPNGYVTHPVLTQPLHHCMKHFYLLRNNLCDLRVWSTCKLPFPSAG
jgi:hypothetical protein